MGTYIVRRLGQAVIVMLGVIVITFLISRVLGDPVTLLLSPEATEQQRIALTRGLGLDRPLYVQLVVYVGKVVRGDFGESFRFREPVLGLIAQKFPATLYLASVAGAIAIIVALPLGFISAIKRGSLIDKMGMGFAVLGQSVPNFWAGVMMITVFAVKWKLVPPSGYEGWRSVILPGVSLSLFFAAATARLTRSYVLDVLETDYIRYARLKGIPEIVVLTRHVLRNTFINIFNIVALQFGYLLGGSVVTEFVFSWPGLGRLSVEAIYGRDYPVIQATVLLVSFGFVLINLFVDIVNMISDPRIKRG